MLAKPFSAEALVETAKAALAERWAHTGRSEVEGRIGDDISTEMVNIYKQCVPQYLRDLIIALFSQQPQQLKFQAHKLQSAMWVMEYMEIYEMLERLESETFSFEAFFPPMSAGECSN